MDQLESMDALVWLREFDDGCVDFSLQDPAYSSLEKHRKRGTTTRLKKSKSSNNAWFPVVSNAYLHVLMHELYRVHRKNSHCYVMCDEETLMHIVPYAKEAGWTFWKSVIWDRGRLGMGYHYRNQTERIAFFEKGKLKLNDLSIPDILQVDSVRSTCRCEHEEEVYGECGTCGNYRAYPTEKPVELLEVFLLQSSEEGEFCIDTFMGSGSTMEAAVKNGRLFMGTDLNNAPARDRALKLKADYPDFIEDWV